VRDLQALDRYPWSGHATLVGWHPYSWQDREYVLGWFGARQGRALREYRKYVHEGIFKGRRPELVGGGLVRSLGGWAEVQAVRRLRRPVLADPRILGSGPFVEQVIQRGDERIRAIHRREDRQRLARIAIAEECRKSGVNLEELQQGSRRYPFPRLRGKLAGRAIEEWGLSLADAARQLGVSTSAVAKIVRRRSRK
jgi:hypothetical protein